MELKVCDASIGPLGKAYLSNFRKIGVVEFDGLRIEIKPKVSVRQVLQMLDPNLKSFQSLASDASLASTDEWTHALADFFEAQLSLALRRGPLEGYREEEEWSRTIKGRIQFSKFATTPKFASPDIPIIHDDFSINIPENMIIFTALNILLSKLDLGKDLRARHLARTRMLDGVNLLQAGAKLQNYRLTSRNMHYAPALATAELIILSQSFTASPGGHLVKSFLIDMPRLFETFIELEFLRLSKAAGIDFRPQKGNQYLDESQMFRIQPDYLWFQGGKAIALADAKYKSVASPSEISNADVNQVIAYCSRFGLKEGHLIFAEAPEFETTMFNSEITLIVHQLDLGHESKLIREEVSEIFDSILGVRANSSED
jgi:5-methylcytosine-specific restriction enzyme subunit McrC